MFVIPVFPGDVSGFLRNRHNKKRGVPWSRWPHDLGLELRMVVTLFLLMVIYFVFIAVLAYIGVETLFLVAIVAIILLFQYFFSDRMVLWLWAPGWYRNRKNHISTKP